ncbi:MAG: Methyltransferase type 11 (Modular protein) [Nitrospirae bacterium]|nr:MAG: Methyltransferase type 11 (Modular protein) [Nitrospirota bacterium]
MKNLVRELLPPILLRALVTVKKYISHKLILITSKARNISSKQQDLDVYWDPNMAIVLETWGEKNVWNEIQFLMANCRGRVLDIACGTGKAIDVLSKFPFISVHGCDISDFLIEKAVQRGIKVEYLKICDASKTNYPDLYFDYSYSIGSLEHFTEDGIHKFIKENFRTTQKAAYHFIPVSKSGRNEGWIKTFQSYFNNSTDWWLNKFKTIYPVVYVLDSVWHDDISDGRWFICIKEEDIKEENKTGVA